MRTIVSLIPNIKSFYRGEQVIEVGYPWITFGAIMALEHILRGQKNRFNILEMGSGGSTIFFSRRCKSLLSLEHDPRWYKKVKDALPVPSNVNLICKPIPELLKIINQQPDGYFDMVLADGGSSYEERLLLMNASINKIKRYGWLVIDNYLFCDRFFNYVGWDIYTFDMFHFSGRGTRLCKKLW